MYSLTLIKNLQLVILLLALTTLGSCSDRKSSPEDEVRQFIEAGKQAAENRDYSDLSNLIHQSYQDQKGFDKKQITKMSRAYFLMHSNIHLFTQINSIDFKNENEAFVVLHVAMAGNAITGINALTSLRARVYRFELLLINDNKWLLKQARWQQGNIQDML